MQILAGAAIIGGMGLSAYGTLSEGKEAAKMGKIKQAQLNAEAEATEQAGQFEAREKRKEALRFRAKQIADMSANGGVITGSNITLIADSAENFESDALNIGRNYKLKATQLRNEGALAAYQGRMARYASRIRATSDVLMTAGTMYLMGNMGKGGSTKGFGPTNVSGAGAPTAGDIGRATTLRY